MKYSLYYRSWKIETDYFDRFDIIDTFQNELEKDEHAKRFFEYKITLALTMKS